MIATILPTSGLIGALVTLTGSNFGETQGGSTVKFNGIVATPSTWGNAAITAPVPNGATTGNVLVTVAGISSNALPFTVTPPPPPPPPVASFAGIPLMGSTPLTVTFTDTSSGAPTSWAWDFDNDGIVDSTAQNPVKTYSAAGTFSVSLSVSNAGGSNSAVVLNYVVAQNPPPPSADWAPIAGAGGTISASSSAMAASLNWTKATDDVTPQASLLYEVRISKSDNIVTVATAEANGTLARGYTANLSSISISGLAKGTQYYAVVIVKDAVGNKTAYRSIGFKTKG